MATTVRRLTPAEAESFRDVRLEGLVYKTESFVSRPKMNSPFP
jgi:hypothetical protein